LSVCEKKRGREREREREERRGEQQEPIRISMAFI
jgi:hypothetical protein